MLVQAALWYSRGLLLAFPTAWTSKAFSFNRFLPETEPPGTKALALALLYNRGCVSQALAEMPEMDERFHKELWQRASADAIWCLYYGGRS